ncbi:MAG TPA: DUF3237 domain-containing protein [Acidisphaera sp.]|nr:DUF3237 domain-containing protein [Acidisphaera sp.]
MAEIRTAHLFTIRLQTAAPPQLIGAGPAGDRRVVVVSGGTFEGARLRGTVIPGGTDWIIARADGALALDVRLVLKADDDALIGMTYRGMRHGPEAVIARLNRGEAVDPSDYYFRTAVFFETGAPQHAWLNRLIAIATGDRKPDGPHYDVFEVL